MKQQLNHQQLTYNDYVALAYFQLLKQTRQMLAAIEHEELRYTLERIDRKQTQIGSIIHELINPLIYLRLELHTDNQMAIHFGIEQTNQQGQLSELTSKFLLLLYKLTSKDTYPVDIESSVRTDWFINSCSEMYEYMEVRNKYHTFRQIKYKVSAQKRKQLLSVA